MKIDLKGATRIVFLIGDWAFKIPNFRYEHHHFLIRCTANWEERKLTKTFSKYEPYYQNIAPTVFCSWFGLLSIQVRCKPLLRDLTEDEKKNFENQTTDIKKENFGYLKCGRLVCLDYAT